MDEVVDILEKILEKLETIDDSINELNSKLDDIQGFGLYNSIADVCDKLTDLESTADSIENDVGWIRTDM